MPSARPIDRATIRVCRGLIAGVPRILLCVMGILLLGMERASFRRCSSGIWTARKSEVLWEQWRWVMAGDCVLVWLAMCWALAEAGVLL